MYKIIWLWFNPFLIIYSSSIQPTCAAGIVCARYFKCHKSHLMCTRCSVCCWNWFAMSIFPHVSRLILCIYCCPSIDSLPPSLSLHIPLPSYSLPVRISSSGISWHCSSLSIVSLSPPCLHHSMLNLDEWTFLRYNAITSMDACMCTCACVGECASVCATQTLPGGKHGCSLLSLLLFQIMVCFINAMVICFLLILWSPCLSKWRESSKDTHWSKRLQRPCATQPVSTVSIFHECCWRKVVIGELQQTICTKQRAGKHSGATAGMAGPLVSLHGQLVFHYTLIYAAVIHLDDWLTQNACG